METKRETKAFPVGNVARLLAKGTMQGNVQETARGNGRARIPSPKPVDTSRGHSPKRGSENRQSPSMFVCLSAGYFLCGVRFFSHLDAGSDGSHDADYAIYQGACESVATATTSGALSGSSCDTMPTRTKQLPCSPFQPKSLLADAANFPETSARSFKCASFGLIGVCRSASTLSPTSSANAERTSFERCVSVLPL